MNYISAVLFWVGLIFGGWISLDSFPPSIQRQLIPYIEKYEELREQQQKESVQFRQKKDKR